MVAIAEIYQFIHDNLNIPLEDLAEDSDLFQTFTIRADECADFIEQFAAQFKVDLTDYRWYFHHGESGLNLGGLLIKPPYQRVERIPITPTILLKAATKKRWKIQYPEHSIPKKRWDMIINKGILFLVFFYTLNHFIPSIAAKFQ